jgi:SAM-dependent methyltransferase
MLVSNIPVLLAAPDPDDHLAGAAATLQRHLTMANEAHASLTAQLAFTRRPAVIPRLVAGAEATSLLLRRLLGALDHTWPLARAQRPGAATRHPLNFTYLLRDWSRQPYTEETIVLVTASLRRAIAGAVGGTAVMLGAGLGRYAWELAPELEKVVAVDLSVSSALLYAVLAKGDIDFCELDEQNLAAIDDVCRPVRCTLCAHPDEAARLDRLAWAVADGCAVPMRDGSASTLLSVYFTDRVSPRTLLDEAVRLLAPGGRFVHFGPFGYEHGNVEDMLTAEELCTALEERGFEIALREWVPHILVPSRRLVQPFVRAFACAAIRR